MNRQITLNPRSAYGSLATGVQQFDHAGEVQAIPNTGTPPYGEPGMHAEPDQAPWPVDPPINQAATDDLLHEAINGAPYHGYEIEEWVNPTNPGIPNLGPVNDQPFESGHSQIVVHNPSAEQGWGMDPAILLARYPHVENTNPFYASGTHRRNGAMNVTIDGYPMTDRELSGVQYQQGRNRRRSTTHSRLVNQPAGVPFSQTVPIQMGALIGGPLGEDEAVYG